jgi:hypothetical protein
MIPRQNDALFEAQHGLTVRRGAPVLAEGAAGLDFRVKKLVFYHDWSVLFYE